jgi:hypothetical protein
MSLVDQILPEYEFKSSVRVPIAAGGMAVFEAFRAVTMRDMPVAWALGTLRYLPGRFTGHALPPSNAEVPFIKQLIDGGSVILAEDPGREIVLGSAGKYHQIKDQEPVQLRSAKEFLKFDREDYQKLAVSVRIEETPVTGERDLVLEHRTHALGLASQNAFARYWIVIRPMGDFVSWLLLRAVRRRAEGGECAGGRTECTESDRDSTPEAAPSSPNFLRRPSGRPQLRSCELGLPLSPARVLHRPRCRWLCPSDPTDL